MGTEFKPCFVIMGKMLHMFDDPSVLLDIFQANHRSDSVAWKEEHSEEWERMGDRFRNESRRYLIGDVELAFEYFGCESHKIVTPLPGALEEMFGMFSV